MAFLDGLFGGKKENQIALFVDGPNVIRKQLNIDLREVKKRVEGHGNIRLAKIYLDQFASDKLIEAMVNQGFQPVITTGDVDVTMAVEAMEHVVDSGVDTIALMTRDTDFIPVLNKVKEHGKKTMIVGVQPGFSAALKNTADTLILLEANEAYRPHAPRHGKGRPGPQGQR